MNREFRFMRGSASLQAIRVTAIFLIVFMLLLIPNSGYAQTIYYVSSQGDDTNPGTTESSSWKTITKVNSRSFSAGDFVNFKGGQRFADAVLLTKSGVTYTSYGTGQAIIGDSVSTTVAIINTQS